MLFALMNAVKNIFPVSQKLSLCHNKFLVFCEDLTRVPPPSPILVLVRRYPDLGPDWGTLSNCKDLGPEAGKGPWTRNWGTLYPPLVNRQTSWKNYLPIVLHTRVVINGWYLFHELDLKFYLYCLIEKYPFYIWIIQYGMQLICAHFIKLKPTFILKTFYIMHIQKEWQMQDICNPNALIPSA